MLDIFIRKPLTPRTLRQTYIPTHDTTSSSPLDPPSPLSPPSTSAGLLLLHGSTQGGYPTHRCSTFAIARGGVAGTTGMRRVPAVAVQNMVELGDRAVTFDADGHCRRLWGYCLANSAGSRERHSVSLAGGSVSERVTASAERITGGTSGWSVRIS